MCCSSARTRSICGFEPAGDAAGSSTGTGSADVPPTNRSARRECRHTLCTEFNREPAIFAASRRATLGCVVRACKSSGDDRIRPRPRPHAATLRRSADPLQILAAATEQSCKPNPPTFVMFVCVGRRVAIVVGCSRLTVQCSLSRRLCRWAHLRPVSRFDQQGRDFAIANSSRRPQMLNSSTEFTPIGTA